MDHDPADVERLARQLRDERRQRDAADRRAADQAERAQVWRERAEARAERLDRLVAQLDHRRTLAGRVRANVAALLPGRGDDGDAAAPATPPTRTAGPAPRSRRGLTGVQVAHLVDADGDLRRVVDQCTAHDLAADVAGLHEADVVVLDAAAWVAAPAALRDAVARWAALDGRQPLVWAGPTPELPGPVTGVRAGTAALPHTFDPAVDVPVGRPGHVAHDPAAAGAGARQDVDAGAGALSATASHAAVVAAARAQAVVAAREPVRAGDARRRLAWAGHHPAVVGAALFRAAGLSFEAPVPEVAALLVSNRPDDLRTQLVALAGQAHRPLRVQVGCHGFAASTVGDALDEVAAALPVDVLELPSHRPLGWCLNRAAEAVGSPVLAKVDDDDHYGPGYLVDAVQALDYAGADLVGRVAAFVHVEGHDRTVLRRPGAEEQVTAGPVVGATMVWRRAAWERTPFAHKTLAEDVSLQRGIRAAGGTLYAASRWDFVYRRRTGGNTWRAPDDHFTVGSRPAWDGFAPWRADLVPAGP